MSLTNRPHDVHFIPPVSAARPSPFPGVPVISSHLPGPISPVFAADARLLLGPSQYYWPPALNRFQYSQYNGE